MLRNKNQILYKISYKTDYELLDAAKNEQYSKKLKKNDNYSALREAGKNSSNIDLQKLIQDNKWIIPTTTALIGTILGGPLMGTISAVASAGLLKKLYEKNSDSQSNDLDITVSGEHAGTLVRNGKKVESGLNQEQKTNFLKYREPILKYAKLFNLDPAILAAQIFQESAYLNKFISGSSVSSAGAFGISQFMPATLASLKLDTLGRPASKSEVLKNPALGIEAQAKYLRQMLDLPYVGGDIIKALAAYNAGPGNVQKYGGVPPFNETKNYVSDIPKNAKSYFSKYFS